MDEFKHVGKATGALVKSSVDFTVRSMVQRRRTSAEWKDVSTLFPNIVLPYAPKNAMEVAFFSPRQLQREHLP